MRRSAVALVAVLVLAVTAPAGARPAGVSIQFQAFAPSGTEILPGETVTWSNVSERTHTVTADDGTFDSGELLGGSTFARTYPAVGSFAYHCTIHPTMTGTVDVRRVILDPFPPAAIPAGEGVDLTGRTADPGAPVAIERDTGAGFHPVALADPAPDGSWRARVPALSTSDYRATVGAGSVTSSSATRRLLVSDRKVLIRPTRAGVEVTVTPSFPHAVVVLQLKLRDRFGWWPQVRVALDYLSRADFRVAGSALARVVLVDSDGWTPVATSASVRVRPAAVRRPPAVPHRTPAPHMPHM